MQRPILLILVVLFVTPLAAQDMAGAAQRFIQTLTSEQRTGTLYPFETDERYNFHFVPRERKGITFNDMNEAQRKAALELMRTGLSETAFRKTQEIMQLDAVLKELEKRKPDDHYRDPGNYHFSVFGIPSMETIWGWRFEGHHISFNFSMNKGKIVAGTPAFLGANPAIVQEGAFKGKQVLQEETEAGFALLRSFTTAQRARAVTDTKAPRDIVSFNSREARLDNTRGIGYDDLQPAQQQLLLQLVNVYVHRFTRLFAADLLKEIHAAGLSRMRFEWMGDTLQGVGHPHYYKVQSPAFLLEYDNTQNDGNHVHSVLRDLLHDFGGDELLEHYKKAHKN